MPTSGCKMATPSNQRVVDCLMRETRMMMQVRHLNLVRIVAAVFDEASHTPNDHITELLDLDLRDCYHLSERVATEDQ